MTRDYRPPFPWFGGKSSVASEVWDRFGRVDNYVEPFMGSLAMLMLRPRPFSGTETVNDADGFICNFWRAVRHDPEAVAHHADWPVNENDLHARHVWLKDRREGLTARLEGDPDYCDAKIAGWWAWGQCCWIGSGWCAEGRGGPWGVVEIDGIRQLVHLGDAGQGVNRQLVHLGNAGRGVNRQLVHLGNAGQGVNRKRVHLGDAGQDGEGEWPTASGSGGLVEYFGRLCERLRRVRVCCGDWSRVCGPTVTVKQGLTAVFLDPPYADTAERTEDLYSKDSARVAHDVREWAVANGDDPRLRIALCGYAGEHAMPESWTEWAWKAKGGYGSQSKAHDNPNARRERIWFSPHCRVNDMPLFGGA
jgi:hypothetical protein